MKINNKVKNVIVISHGVHSKESKNNLRKVEEAFKNDPLFDETWHIEFIHYGYVFFLTTLIPFVKHNKIKRVQNRLGEIQQRFPNALIHIVAHSFGTGVCYEAIKRSDYDNLGINRLEIGSLITVAGIIDSYDRFEDTIGQGQIQKVFNFCSYKDRVIRWQPIFGKCGYLGFCTSIHDKSHKFQPHEDLPVYNYRFDLRHSEYFSDNLPDFFEMWASLIRRNRKK